MDCDPWNTISTISEALIALLNLVLVFYIFFYDKSKDKKQVRLEWFRELIIQPKLEYLYSTFDNIIKVSRELNQEDPDRIEILRKIKYILYTLRKDFIESLSVADENLRNKMLIIVDDLVDVLSEEIVDENNDFSSYRVLTKKVLDRVRNTRNGFVKTIFDFSG